LVNGLSFRPLIFVHKVVWLLEIKRKILFFIKNSKANFLKMLNLFNDSLYIKQFGSIFLNPFPVFAELPIRFTSNEIEEAVNSIDEEIEVVNLLYFEGLIFLTIIKFGDDSQVETEFVVVNDQDREDHSKECNETSEFVKETENGFEITLDVKNLTATLDIEGEVVVHFLSVA
jgi:hypothetical protein